MRRGVRSALPVLLVALLLAGCASIQDQSQPVAVQNQPIGDSGPTIDGPKPGEDQWALVRSFVRANAQTAKGHTVPRSFIAGERAKTWNPGRRITVIADDFSTNPNPGEVPGDPDQQSVLLRARKIGTLAADGSFLAAQGNDQSYEQNMTVAKDRDNEWRIRTVADGLIIRVSDFQRAFQQVTLDFMEPKLQAPIPDVRYLPRGQAPEIASRIVNDLIQGPSTALQPAVRNNFTTIDSEQQATVQATNPDSVTVNLPPVGTASEAQRRGMAEQIVRSLRGVVGGQVEVRSDGAPLDPKKQYYKYSDLPSYSLFSPSQDAGPLYVAGGVLKAFTPSSDSGAGGKDDASKIDATAGLSDCQAVSGARSLDGDQLAMVCAGRDKRERIRIGTFGKSVREVPDLAETEFTRPTWTAGSPQSQVGYEVWTVADGHRILRLHRDGESWQVTEVDAGQLFDQFGQGAAISDLRLSRDGIHAAAIVDGKLVVSTVLRNADGQAQLSAPTQIGYNLANVSDLDWVSQTQLVVVSGRNADSLTTVSADGLYVHNLSTTNMSPPVQRIAAAPGQQFLAVASGSTFSSTQGGDSWVPLGSSSKGADPFYPG
ncbi:LpqB family beta-propeller domain-containing protein [Sciscionella marina]|uniref:LpqB family beta-propeller domain-containing protein n=1 Tax=Sciscionella marina TaxID=508770 RepID=UPI0003A8303F|nr:LpqB family beta-propeller domain-containing protein [Sciscionella marina]